MPVRSSSWRSDRRSRGTVGFAIAAAGLVFAGSLIVPGTREAGHTRETISARRFVLLDEQGRQRAILGYDLEYGPGLILADEKGEARVVIREDPASGPSLTSATSRVSGARGSATILSWGRP